MPSPCCIPGCNSNYKSALRAGEESVSVFRFPKDANIKTQWLNAIPRGDWSPTQYTVVCAKHFVPSDIIREDIYLSPDGTTKKIPTKVRLTPAAVPYIFPNLSGYLSKTDPTPRKSPTERNKEHQNHIEQLNQALEESDIIKDFKDLLNYSQKINVSEFWEVKVVNDSKIYFYTLDLTNDCVNIINQVSVDSNMEVRVFVKGNELYHNNDDVKWILPFELSRWSQLDNILAWYKDAL